MVPLNLPNMSRYKKYSNPFSAASPLEQGLEKNINQIAMRLACANARHLPTYMGKMEVVYPSHM